MGRGSFQTLLDYDRVEDLQRMYVLLSRIPEGLDPLRKIFEEYVKKVGQTAVSKLLGEGTEGADGLVPEAYVNSALFGGDAPLLRSGPRTVHTLRPFREHASTFFVPVQHHTGTSQCGSSLAIPLRVSDDRDMIM